MIPGGAMPKAGYGSIAQLGERLHGMQEVGGSIPPGSTTLRPSGYAGRPKGEDGLVDTSYPPRSSGGAIDVVRLHHSQHRVPRPGMHRPYGRSEALASGA